MASFNLSANTTYKWDDAAFATRAGNDTYTLYAGSKLVIDCDTRYCNNASATTGNLGSITTYATSVSAEFFVDGTKVRLVPFSSGSGNVPAIGTTISQGGVSGELLGVWSAINVPPTAAGSAMPASGFIKLRSVSGGTFASGALTGIGASATGADIAGWIEVVGTDSTSLTIYRLAKSRMTGGWFDLGTTSGSAGQTVQLPGALSNTMYGGVYIETSPGSNDYEFYANAGTLVASTTPTDAIRGKLCWINSSNVLRLGSDGTNTVGYVPVSGCKIRIPNIVLINTNSTVGYGANSTSLATKKVHNSSSNGVFIYDKVCFGWSLNFDSHYAITLSDIIGFDQLFLNNNVGQVSCTRVGIGQSAAIVTYGIRLRYAKAGATLTDCVFTAVGPTNDATDIYDGDNLIFTRCKFQKLVNKTSSGTNAFYDSSSANVTLDRCTFIGGKVTLVTITSGLVKDSIYIDNAAGTTSATYSNSAISLNTKSSGIVIDGLSFGGLVNQHPYQYVIDLYGAVNCKVRNIGTLAAPLDCGSANPTRYGIYTNLTFNAKIQRCYFSNLGTSLYASNTPDDEVVYENCGGGLATALQTPSSRNTRLKGVAGSSSAMTSSSLGNHFQDIFTSTTAGKIILSFAEPSAKQPSASTVSVISGSPAFNGSGGLWCSAVGDSIEWTTPEYILGHTGFQNVAPVLNNGSISNFTIQYQLDKNDGNGFGALTTMTAANLSAETGIDASKGFKLKVRMTCATANTDGSNSLVIATNSTTTAQGYQYPLEVATLTVSGIPVGAEVRFYTGAKGASAVEIGGTESASSTSFSFTHTSGGVAGFIHIVHPDYKLKEIDYTYAATDFELLVQMEPDKWYSNP